MVNDDGSGEDDDGWDFEAGEADGVDSSGHAEASTPVPGAGAINATGEEVDDDVGSGSDTPVVVAIEKGKGKGRGASKGPRQQSRKRGRKADIDTDDDDFESQPTILKWFRQVPGPLQDVIKQQQADLQQSMDDDGVFPSGRSSGHMVHISTVFDKGPWVDMCDFLGMATTPGELYGGIKMSSLRYTITQVLEDDKSSPKLPRLLVLIKSMRYVDEEIFALFHDPTGEIEGYFHRDVVEQVGPALTAGVGVLLRDVSVFAPTDAAVGGTQKRFLNIISRNVERVFIATPGGTYEAMVEAFNLGQENLIEEEKKLREEIDDDARDQRPRPVLAPADVRTAANELSFLSQRQVVHRHRPVRPTTTDGGDASSASASNAAGQTGLGRWQWHKLAQKKPENAPLTATTTNSVPPSTVTTTATVPSSSGSRFKDLLSQHMQARSRLTNAIRNATVSTAAPPTTNRTPPPGSFSSATQAGAKSTIKKKAVNFALDEDDEDDDW